MARILTTKEKAPLHLASCFLLDHSQTPFLTNLQGPPSGSQRGKMRVGRSGVREEK
jgi:hypothetical protein